MIRITVEGLPKTGKSTVVCLIAVMLKQNGIPNDLEDADGDIRHVALSITERLDAVVTRMCEDGDVVEIVERCVDPTRAA